MADPNVRVRLSVDDAASPKINQLKQNLSGLAASGNVVGGLIGGIAGGATVKAFDMLSSAVSGTAANFQAAIGHASDLNETISKTNVVLGDASGAVAEWSRGTASAMGMSQNTALQAASGFAVFGKSAGLVGEDLAEFSTGFVGLAADLASFSNTTPEQAIQAIGAALRGESEPIRSYGVLLDEATLRQEALALGIVQTTTQALTPQQRVLAAEAALWRQTADAQGDFERTSGGLANQQRILAANMENLSATVGTAFLPAMTSLTEAGNELVTAVLPDIGDMITTYVVPAMKDMAEYITIAAGNISNFLTALDQGADPLGELIDMFDLEPWAVELNNAIGWFEWMANEWNREMQAMKIMSEGWAIDFIVQVNKVIAAINTIGAGGNDFFNQFGAQAAAITGNPFTPSAPPNWIPELPVPASQYYAPPEPITLNRIPLSGGTPSVFEGGWGYGTMAREASDAAQAAALATAETDKTRRSLGELGTAASGAGSSAERAFDNLRSKVQSMLSGALNPGVSIADGLLPREDAINENARRLAAIANEGIGDQSWMEEFKNEVPGIFDEIVNSANPQAAAARIFQEFQAGLRPELIDKDLVKERIKAAIVGEQQMGALATEIAQELAAEMGVSLPEALSAAQSALGVNTGGDSATGFVAGVDGDQIAADSLAKIAAGFLDKQKAVDESGRVVGAWWGAGFMAVVGDNVPVGLLDMLTSKLLPMILARIAQANSTSGTSDGD